MEFSLEIISYALVALAVALLPFSVAIFSSAYRCIELNESFIIGIFFSFFQGFLMLLGWWIGYSLRGYFASLTFAIASLLFLMVGLKMFFDARQAGLERRTYSTKDFRILLGFSLAVSINAFLIGISLGLIRVNALLMAAMQIFMTYLAVLVGIRLGKLGKYRLAISSEHMAAVIFVGVAIFMVVRYFNLV